jgi:hypothetical protein
MNKVEVENIVEKEMASNPVKGVGTIIRDNWPIVITILGFVMAWSALNAEVQRIHAQQDINTTGITEEKAVQQKILISLERIETNQANMLKTIDGNQIEEDKSFTEIKADLKAHINQN